MIRTVIFDIGNVLLHFSHEKMCRQVGQLCGIDADLLWNTLMIKGLGREYEMGNITTEELFAYFSAIGTTPHTQEQLFCAFSDIFEVNHSIIPVIGQLKEKGVRLVLLSNISEMHMNFIMEQYPFLSAFDQAALSFQIKSMKPQEGIFRAALAAAKCHPEECFYIDDIAEYIEAAKRLGIDAEQFTTTEQFLAHLEHRGLILD